MLVLRVWRTKMVVLLRVPSASLVPVCVECAVLSGLPVIAHALWETAPALVVEVELSEERTGVP